MMREPGKRAALGKCFIHRARWRRHDKNHHVVTMDTAYQVSVCVCESMAAALIRLLTI